MGILKNKVSKIKLYKKAYSYYSVANMVYKNINDLIIMSCEQAQIGMNIVLRKEKTINLLIRNIEKGEYEIVFLHKSQEVAKSRKSIWMSFIFSDKYSTLHTAKEHNLNYDQSNGIFSYFGGGRWYKNKFATLTKIKINKKTDFMFISINTSRDSEEGFLLILPKSKLNSDLLESIEYSENKNLSLSNGNKNEVKVKEIFDMEKISRTVAPIRNIPAFVVYANISPNVVDGSSIWLSSIVDIISNLFHVILVLKETPKSNIIISNIKNSKNVTIIDPSDIGDYQEVNERQAIDIIKAIDNFHPKIFRILVRGMQASKSLVDDRTFKYRSVSYLTDFYKIENNHIEIVEPELLKQICLQSYLVLVQTNAIKEKINSVAQLYNPNFEYLTPSVPNSIKSLSVVNRELTGVNEIVIGYAGKIMPNWGVVELLQWVKKYNSLNNLPKIKLEIVANKISAPGAERKVFVSKILNLLDEEYITHYKDLNREGSLEVLSKVDYVWAFRPAELEEMTLELSTKLLESIALEKKVFVYPSKLHIDELGEGYPYFIKDYEDFENIIFHKVNDLSKSTDLSNKIIAEHKIDNISNILKNSNLFRRNMDDSIEKMISKKICFAGHDYKFIDPYISYLKSQGVSITKDVWGWGEPTDINFSKHYYEWADVIFCEWGLANAVWYSKNNIENKPIYIRVHLQEINAKAVKFGRQINFDNITQVIFVSERVRDEYIQLFNLPKEKSVVIPNFVLDDEYILNSKRRFNECITLGMVGVVPTRKRLDRAVDLLEILINNGVDARLKIKGHRPENLEFMHGPARKKELDYYFDIYKRIDENSRLKELITFEPWGNDVAIWYQDIDFILSPSDFESFHYAMADGILSGCTPIIWNWNEAKVIYKNEWIVKSNEEAFEKIMVALNSESSKQQLIRNRQFIIERYGKRKIFTKLNVLINEVCD